MDRLVAGLANGESMLIVSPLTTSELLTAIGRLLHRTRILRVAPPLALPAFMDQIAANAGADTGNLEHGFNALTMLDTTCDRVALIVEDAHLLPPETLRYIDLSFWSAHHLQIILAGQPAVTGLLAAGNYATLRKRLALEIIVPSLPAALPDTQKLAPPKPITAQRPEFGPGTSRVLASRSISLAGAAMGAAIVLAMFLVRPLPLRSPASSPSVIAMVGLNPASTSGIANPPMTEPVAQSLAPEPAPIPASAAAATATEMPPEAEPTVSAGVQPDMVGSMPVPDPELSPPLLTDATEPPAVSAGTPATEPNSVPPPMAATLAAPASGPNAEPLPGPAAGSAQAPATVGPTDLSRAIPILATPRPTPPIPKRAPPRLAAQPAPLRAERATSPFDPALSYGQRCRAIVQRALIGETPTDADVFFLRNGCR